MIGVSYSCVINKSSPLRVPQNDIKEAHVSIKEAYKVYWNMKTRALEETLMDITFCDDVQGNVTGKSPLKTSTNDQRQDRNSSPEKSASGTENIDPHDSKREVENTNQNTDTVNMEGVWGEHLHKSKEPAPKKKQAMLIGRSSSFQLSRNKFESSSFTKRNPRKSLSSAKLRNRTDKSTSSSTSIDRAETSSKDGFDVTATEEEAKSIFGESNIKVTFGSSKPVAHCINTVQQLVDGHMNTVNRNLNPGWLDRCTRYSNLQVASLNPPKRLSGTSDSGVESMESSVLSPQDTVAVHSATSLRVSDEEEDFICNSDSEEERRNKRIRNFKKRWSDQNDRLAKRRCVGVETDAITPSTGATHGATSGRISSVNSTRSDVVHEDGCSKSGTDDVDAFKSIDYGSANESIKTQTNKVIPDSRIGPNVITDDAVVSKDAQNEYNRTRSESKTADGVPELTDLPNRESGISSNEKPVKEHVSRRRGIIELSNDSDPDYVEETNRRTRTRTRKTAVRAVRKSTGKRKATNDEGKPNLRRSARRKFTLDTKNDEEPSSDETQAGTFPIYGVETLQTVPRFAMKSTESGDLVAQFSRSVCDLDALGRDASVPSRTSGKLTDKEKLEKKIAAGTMNDNFVRINLKKKVFVRGKKNFNLSKYKKNQWKQRKKELTSSESNLDAADLMDKNGTTCFKCGESGHFAKNCSASKSAALLPLEEMAESSSFPTLEEAERMANENAVVAHGHKIDRLPVKPSFSTATAESQSNEAEDVARLFDDDDDFTEPGESREPAVLGHKIPQELLSRLLPPQMDVVEPLYSTNEDGSLAETPTEVYEALRMFGHESFRVGQEKAVMRILSGQSTLVTLSTGSGKSLCYQLPAYLYSRHSRCITLVISPLVSLMDDQVTGVPAFLSAACLHTSQTPKVREQVMRSVKNGTVNILLVSPEAVVAGEKSTGFGALLRQLPPIAFACIDEAHCISQWSHNFRPSYLMVCRVLKEKLRVRTVLGLTATATRATAESIVRHLYLHDGMAGVISDVPLPKNLVLTVSKDERKDQALIALLRGERFRECDSVIVYCTRREECARVAGLLRVSLQVCV